MAELARQIRLVEFLERASLNVPDQHPGSEFNDGRLVAGDGTSEDVYFDAAGSEELGHFDDVNVETACITCSWLLKRRRVNGDGRDSLRVATRHLAYTSETGEP